MAGKVNKLQKWCAYICRDYPGVSITNMTTSWRDGLAFCAMIHRHRPDLIDFHSLSKENAFDNNKLAFDVADLELGIPALLDAEDMVKLTVPDKLSVVTYVSQYYNYFRNKEQKGGPDVKEKVVTKAVDNQRRETKRHHAEEGSPPAAKRTTLGDKCCVCDGKVYIMERVIEENKLYHRMCIREQQRSVRSPSRSTQSPSKHAHTPKPRSPSPKAQTPRKSSPTSSRTPYTKTHSPRTHSPETTPRTPYPTTTSQQKNTANLGLKKTASNASEFAGKQYGKRKVESSPFVAADKTQVTHKVHESEQFDRPAKKPFLAGIKKAEEVRPSWAQPPKNSEPVKLSTLHSTPTPYKSSTDSKEIAAKLNDISQYQKDKTSVFHRPFMPKEDPEEKSEMSDDFEMKSSVENGWKNHASKTVPSSTSVGKIGTTHHGLKSSSSATTASSLSPTSSSSSSSSTISSTTTITSSRPQFSTGQKAKPFGATRPQDFRETKPEVEIVGTVVVSSDTAKQHSAKSSVLPSGPSETILLHGLLDNLSNVRKTTPGETSQATKSQFSHGNVVKDNGGVKGTNNKDHSATPLKTSAGSKDTAKSASSSASTTFVPKSAGFKSEATFMPRNKATAGSALSNAGIEENTHKYTSPFLKSRELEKKDTTVTKPTLKHEEPVPIRKSREDPPKPILKTHFDERSDTPNSILKHHEEYTKTPKSILSHHDERSETTKTILKHHQDHARTPKSILNRHDDHTKTPKSILKTHEDRSRSTSPHKSILKHDDDRARKLSDVAQPKSILKAHELPNSDDAKSRSRNASPKSILKTSESEESSVEELNKMRKSSLDSILKPPPRKNSNSPVMPKKSMLKSSDTRKQSHSESEGNSFSAFNVKDSVQISKNVDHNNPTRLGTGKSALQIEREARQGIRQKEPKAGIEFDRNQKKIGAEQPKKLNEDNSGKTEWQIEAEKRAAMRAGKYQDPEKKGQPMSKAGLGIDRIGKSSPKNSPKTQRRHVSPARHQDMEFSTVGKEAGYNLDKLGKSRSKSPHRVVVSAGKMDKREDIVDTKPGAMCSDIFKQNAGNYRPRINAENSTTKPVRSTARSITPDHKPEKPVSHDSPRSKGSHDSPRSKGSHDSPRSNESHNSPRSNGSHDSPRSNGSHDSPRSNGSHDSPRSNGVHDSKGHDSSSNKQTYTSPESVLEKRKYASPFSNKSKNLPTSKEVIPTDNQKSPESVLKPNVIANPSENLSRKENLNPNTQDFSSVGKSKFYTSTDMNLLPEPAKVEHVKTKNNPSLLNGGTSNQADLVELNKVPKASKSVEIKKKHSHSNGASDHEGLDEINQVLLNDDPSDDIFGRTDVTSSGRKVDRSPAFKISPTSSPKSSPSKAKANEATTTTTTATTNKVEMRHPRSSSDNEPQKTEWQLEAERRQKARQGGFIDPEKNPAVRSGSSSGSTASGETPMSLSPPVRQLKKIVPDKPIRMSFDWTRSDEGSSTEGGSTVSSPGTPVAPPRSHKKNKQAKDWIQSRPLPSPPAGSPGTPMRKIYAEQRVSMSVIAEQLATLDKTLQKMEKEGRQLEEKIRSADDEAMDEDELMVSWFELVNEKNELVRHESYLMHKQRQQEYEDRHSEVEFELRLLMEKPEHLMTSSEKVREQSLLQELQDIVNLRNNIVDSMEEDRIRYIIEDQEIEEKMASRSFCEEKQSPKRKAKKKKKNKRKKEKKEKKEVAKVQSPCTPFEVDEYNVADTLDRPFCFKMPNTTHKHQK